MTVLFLALPVGNRAHATKAAGVSLPVVCPSKPATGAAHP
jgi:hypothetical protein